MSAQKFITGHSEIVMRSLSKWFDFPPLCSRLLINLEGDMRLLEAENLRQKKALIRGLG
jgi:hypothetical protein